MLRCDSGTRAATTPNVALSAGVLWARHGEFRCPMPFANGGDGNLPQFDREIMTKSHPRYQSHFKRTILARIQIASALSSSVPLANDIIVSIASIWVVCNRQPFTVRNSPSARNAVRLLPSTKG